MNQYLLEVGTEELPVGFLQSCPEELLEKVKALLVSENLLAAPMDEDTLTLWVTPRRLALRIQNLASEQPTTTQWVKGPPARIALDPSGQLTQAGLGFVKKQNIDPAQVVQREFEGEQYLSYEQTQVGQPVQHVLASKLPDIFLGLSGSHFMRWGSYVERFSRPIRWIVSLWNSEPLPLSIGPTTSGTVSRGHRVLSKGELTVASIEGYVEQLKNEGHVWVDQTARKSAILKALHGAAQSVGGRVEENEELLDTVTMLVEAPNVVVGRFDPDFLQIPKEVITTVMASHQKYFPVLDVNHPDKLLPYFLTVSNGDVAKAEIIAQGNQRVITARFQDARFFFEEDQKVPLADRVEGLSGITFQKGLGTLLEKTQRVEALSLVVAQTLGYPDSVQKQVTRAARLCKADLVTGMVRELTELQGVMGSRYAALQGEDEAVSSALFEHYLPRFAGDEVARRDVGIAVSIADKLDTLVAVFSQENARFPSGTKDPLGLRRLANGLILTLLENQLSVDLEALIPRAFENLGPMATDTLEACKERVISFTLQRLRGVLQDREIRYDVVDAVFKVFEPASPLTNLVDAFDKMTVMMTLIQEPGRFMPLYEAANRMGRILGEGYRRGAVSYSAIRPELFQASAESAVFEGLSPFQNQGYDGSGYGPWIDRLLQFSPAVSQFFDSVLVNDPDPAIRENRHALLSVAFDCYTQLAYFPALVVTQGASPSAAP